MKRFLWLLVVVLLCGAFWAAGVWFTPAQPGDSRRQETEFYVQTDRCPDGEWLPVVEKDDTPVVLYRYRGGTDKHVLIHADHKLTLVDTPTLQKMIGHD